MSGPEDGGRTRALLRAVVARAESDRERGQHSLRRGIFLLPNLITTGALFAGFYAMVAAMNENFVAAVLATYAAGMLDAADGRVARLTRTQSAFGAEYDSLSDMVAFGVAPAIIAFNFGLAELGQFGWMATFMYVACTALRLARYNTKGTLESFTGLASPAAAGTVVSFIWAVEVWGLSGPVPSALLVTLALLTCGIALLMVSNFVYFSPKVLTFRGRVPFVLLVAVVFVFALIASDPPRVLLVLSVIYALSGPAQWAWQAVRHSSDGADSTKDE